MEFEEYISKSNKNEQQNFIDSFHSKLENTLKYSANLHVPSYLKNYAIDRFVVIVKSDDVTACC